MAFVDYLNHNNTAVNKPFHFQLNTDDGIGVEPDNLRQPQLVKRGLEHPSAGTAILQQLQLRAMVLVAAPPTESVRQPVGIAWDVEQRRVLD